MKYGPVAGPASSVLSWRGDGQPAAYWDPGCPANPATIPSLPPFELRMTTPENVAVVASFPSATKKILVNNSQEVVEEWWARLYPYLGVHAWTERRSDGLIVLEVLIDNGTCDPKTPKSWRGCVRTKSFELRVLDPAWASLDGGVPWDYTGEGYWMPRAPIYRRFALYKKADPVAQAAATRIHGLLDLDLTNGHPALGPLGEKWPRVRSTKWEPLYPATHMRQGPFWYDRDDGSKNRDAMAQGGTGIDPIGGWECTEDAARTYLAELPRVICSNALALSRSSDGEIPRPEEWPMVSVYYLTRGWGMESWQVGQFGPFTEEWLGINDWSSGKNVPKMKEANPGPSTGKSLAMDCFPDADSHLQRITQALSGAWHLCRSWAARHMIRCVAMDVCYSWTLVSGTSPYGNPLTTRLRLSRLNPGKGIAVYARQLWAANAVAEALCVTGDGYFRRWRNSMMEYVGHATMASGIHAQAYPPDGATGEPWTMGLPLSSFAAVVFQEPFASYAALALQRAGPGGGAWEPNLEKMIGKVSQSFIDNPLLPLIQGSPPQYVESSSSGVPVNPVKLGVGRDFNGHANHWNVALACAWLHDPKPYWLDLMMKLQGPGTTLSARLAAWRAAPDAWTALPQVVLAKAGVV